MEPNSRMLYRAFGDIGMYLDDLFEVYKGVYPNAPRITHTIPLLDEESFKYCLDRKYFVLVTPYTEHKELLVSGVLENDQFTWQLVGGGVRRDLMETFIDAAGRCTAEVIASPELGEIEPIAFLENVYTFQEQVHCHYGIAFVARIRNKSPQLDLLKVPYTRGHLVSYKDTNLRVTGAQNIEILEKAYSYLETLKISYFAEFEIAKNEAYQTRYAFHDVVVKPAMKIAGRKFFPDSIDDLNRTVFQKLLAGSHSRGLDVACGENTAVVELAQLPDVDLVVGNDISWSQIQLMQEKYVSGKLRNTNSFVLFTNHDATKLPFGDDNFDFVICKNVLHHMEDLASARKLLSETIRVGKRAVIVEIMDPHLEGHWGTLRHQYYMKFLHDAGRHFLSKEEFLALTDSPFRIEDFEMRTIRGVYQFAVFEKN